MVRLADVLELIHSSRRFRTARLAGRTEDATWRLWWAGDDRFRFEQDREGGGFVSVRAGPVWWTLDASGEANTNDGDPELRLGIPPEVGLLHPRSLLATAILEVLREDRVAGREAVVLRATPRPGAEHWRWWGFWGSTDPMEVSIDLERGVALGGFRFRVEEAAFDEQFDAEVFSQPYPEVHRPVHRGLEIPRELSLEEARAEVAFPVRVPRRLPEGATLLRCLMDPNDPPEWVGLSWAVDPGHRYALHLRQGPAVGREAARSRGREIVRDGVRLLVEEAGGPGLFHTLLVQRGDAWVEIDSTLPLDVIMDIALSIEEAP